MLNAAWEKEILAIELQALVDLELNFEPQICPYGGARFSEGCGILAVIVTQCSRSGPKMSIGLLVLDLLRPR